MQNGERERNKNTSNSKEDISPVLFSGTGELSTKVLENCHDCHFEKTDFLVSQIFFFWFYIIFTALEILKTDICSYVRTHSIVTTF